MRMLQVKIRQGELPGFVHLYEERIIPALQRNGGCLYACLMQSVLQSDEGISMTLWRSEEDALRYERSGLFMQLVAEARPFFANSTEWNLQLSKDFTLEYSQDPTEPTLKSFSVSTTSSETIPSKEKAPNAFLRIVSLHIKPGKVEEYKRLHERDVIPALLATRGCRFSCLSTPTVESNEAISVTMWNSRADAEEYERKGTFNQLLQNISHTLSDLSQLKMRSVGTRLPSVTSEDIEVDGFHLIVSKSFMS
jgi:heme-degrading monooxygenase HmoA